MGIPAEPGALSPRQAVFLDRDGVINEGVPDPRTGTEESPYDPADVRLIAGVPEAIAALAEAGYVLVVASNQPAAAKGTATIEALDAVHERVLELLGPAAEAITRWRYCRHHPDAADPQLRRCDCRKPAPGMLLEAIRELSLDPARSWMIGDADRDIEAGIAAGCMTALVETPGSAHRRAGAVAADLRGPDLLTITRAILSRD